MRQAHLALMVLLGLGVAHSGQGYPQSDSTKYILDNEFVRVSKVDFDLGIDPNAPTLGSGLATLPAIVIVLQPNRLPEWSEHTQSQQTYKFDGVNYADTGHEFYYKYLACDSFKYREVKIEFKSSPPEVPFVDDAVKLDPKHNQIVFENDRVRVVRIHFGIWEKGPMVDKRPRVIILLTDTHAQVMRPDGQLSPRDSTAGTIQWSLGGRQATINGILSPLENIVVELKSPETKGK